MKVKSIESDPIDLVVGHFAGRYGSAMVGTKATDPVAIRSGIILGNASTAPTVFSQ